LRDAIEAPLVPTGNLVSAGDKNRHPEFLLGYNGYEVVVLLRPLREGRKHGADDGNFLPNLLRQVPVLGWQCQDLLFNPLLEPCSRVLGLAGIVGTQGLVAAAAHEQPLLRFPGYKPQDVAVAVTART